MKRVCEFANRSLMLASSGNANPCHSISRNISLTNPSLHPSLLGASSTSKIERCCWLWSLPSLNIRASIRASSPSIFNAGFGVTASRTKWLSQWGQYSSLVARGQHSPPLGSGGISACSPVFKFLSVFPKTFLALLTGKSLQSHFSGRYKSKGSQVYHLECLQQRVICLLCMAFGTVEPPSTWKCFKRISAICLLSQSELTTCRSNGNLSVKNVPATLYINCQAEKADGPC